MNKIILASNSPRRKEILTLAGLAFHVLAADHEEHSDYKKPEDYVKDLARQKAEAAENLIKEEKNFMIIGADTIVVMESRILGKPKDENDAFLMLSNLQGKSHKVFTGISVIITEKEHRKEICFAESTEVSVCSMEPEEIHNYIDTGEPMDKAGSYAIQGKFGKYIEGIHGDYYNVVGFPLNRFYKEMKKNGFGMIFE